MAKLSQPLSECLDKVGCGGWSARRQQPDLRDLGRLLRVNRRAGRGDREEKDGENERSRAHRRRGSHSTAKASA